LSIRLKTDFLILLIFFLCSCELEKTIEVDLPAQEKQLVAEAYAEKGKPLRLLLMETDAYFDTLRIPLLNSAGVFLESGGFTDTLRYEPYLDLKGLKFYNFVSSRPVGNQDAPLRLRIEDLGRRLEGSSRFLPEPQLDSVEIQYNPSGDSTVRFLFWIRDFPGGSNYYRIMLNEDSLTGPGVLEFTFTDNNLDGKLFPVGTSYRFDKNKKYLLRLFHLEKHYYDYLRSISAADRANGNPFAQPATIQSPMNGNGYGIFTSLNVTERFLFP
jgi:hypothetical protein